MLGATTQQQDDIARAARSVGGYRELVEQTGSLPVSSDVVPIYFINSKTRQAHLVSMTGKEKQLKERREADFAEASWNIDSFIETSAVILAILIILFSFSKIHL